MLTGFVPPGGFKPVDMTSFNAALVRFSKSMVALNKRQRERRLNRQGISTGVAPGPFGDSIDISIPVKTPRL